MSVVAVRRPREHAPLVLPAAAVAVGAWLGSTSEADLDLARCTLALAAAFGLAALALLAPGRLTGARFRAMVALATSLGCLAFGRAQIEMVRLRQLPPPLVAARGLRVPVCVSGVLVREPEWGEGRVRLWVEVDRWAFRGSNSAVSMGALLTVRRGADDGVLGSLRYGDRIRAWTVPAPIVGSRNPGGFDESAYLAARGVVLHGGVKSGQLIERVEHAPPSRVVDRCHVLRRAWRAKIRTVLAVRPLDAGLVGAFLLGDRSGVGERDQEAMMAGGTYHLLAISGLHVGLAAALFYGSISLLPGAGLRVRWVATAGVLLGYAVVTEAPPSVVRAVGMALMVVLARLAGERVSAPHAVSLCMVLLLSFRPLDVLDLGLQLTFAATLGIVLLGLSGGWVDGCVAWLPKPVRGWMAVSVAASLVTLPFMQENFHRVAPGGILLNVVAAPLAGIALGAGFLGLLLPVPVAVPLLRLAAVFLRGVVELSAFLALHPPAAYRAVGKGSAMGVVVLAAALGLAVVRTPELLLGWRPSTRLVGSVARGGIALVLAVSVALLVARGIVARRATDLEVTFLDVGEGDAIVVRFPDGATMLVDGGGVADGGFDVGRRVVVPALLSLGVNRLDVVVLTHAHPDHGQGLAALLESLPVGELWEGVRPGNIIAGGFYGELVRAASIAGVPRLLVSDGFVTKHGDVVAEILAPPAGAAWTGRVENDQSIVVRLSLGRTTMLLTGDIERATERALASRVGSVDVLKVAHHGSRTSSDPTFVAGMAPRVAVISVGAANPWGFPSCEALRALGRTTVLRTDESGAVTVTTDGERIEVRTHGVGAGLARPLRLPARPGRR